MNLRIQKTDDGSFTLFSETYQEIYHSRKGALQESRHVFIEMGLKYALREKQAITLLEVGFGTGLNALLSMAHVFENNYSVKYIGLEPFPVPLELLPELQYQHIFEADQIKLLFERIHEKPWDQAITILDQFELLKVKQTLMAYKSQEKIDLVYFDAFAPSKHPGMWEKEVFLHLASMMSKGGILVTYCAKGQVKRDLQAAGFRVEKLPGPPGKREMIRAHFVGVTHPENAS